MLKWLKKFVLDIMPSVTATIVGAYIVNYYIIPKSPAANPAAITATEAKAVDSKADDPRTPDPRPMDALSDKASFEKASFEKAVAEKAAIEKTAEKAAADKGATETSEPRKHQPTPKLAAKPSPAPVDERRANDLARAAIERLAKSEPKPEPVKPEAKTTDMPRVQPVSTVASTPPMQPLPPAINVTTPNPDVFEQGNAAPVMRQPYPQAVSRSDDVRESGRFAPPADIPSSRPLDLRAEAMSPSASERTSVTDEVVSAAKSMFHAVMPR